MGALPDGWNRPKDGGLEMSIPNASVLAENTGMSITRAKDYLALLEQCRKEGLFTDENLDIMHEALLAEAQEKGIDVMQLALSLLIELKQANI